jgi:hypothetical protein
VISLLVSYYSNSYDLTLLLLPLLLLGKSFVEKRVEKRAGWPQILFLGVAAILLCTPLFWIFFLQSEQVGWTALLFLPFAAAIYLGEAARPEGDQSGLDSTS